MTSRVLDVLAKAVDEDEDAACELMDHIALEVMAEAIEKASPDVEALLLPWMKEQVLKAKRGIARGYVSKAASGTYPDESYGVVAKQLAALEVVIKDTEEQRAFEQRERRGSVRRDARGRFTRFVSHAPASAVGHRKDHDLSPANRSFKANNDGKAADQVSGDEKAKQKFLAEQGEWDDARRLMQEFQSTFPGSGKHVEAAFTFRRGNGERDVFAVPLDRARDNGAMVAAATSAGYDLDDSLQFVELQAAPSASDRIKDRVGQFNSIAEQTGSPRAARLFASYDPEAVQRMSGVFGIQDDAQHRRGLKSLFRRTEAAGGVLEGISGTEKYGRMVRLAGEMGAQADAALGPAAQRAAYRYRGTEKQADPDLRRAFTSHEMQLVDAVGESDNPSQRRGIVDDIRAQARQRGGTTPVLGSLEHQLRESARRPEPMLGDELAMKVRSDVAAAHMIETLPDDPRAAELSIASGHVLPSQGVIIDSDGDVVSQAVGYGEDHYLPFDLKNVRRLRGGQYVRTRMQGGPTGEDIYTLVATGARMGTVVSSSGVFTLEMDPNFRGRRGQGDKARMVYRRYLEILDAVEGSGMYVRDLPQADKARVDETARSMGIEHGTDEYDALLQAKRVEQMKLSADEVERIEAEARQELQSDRRFAQLSNAAQNTEVASLTDERVTERKSELVRQLSLNAEGYALAMKTLQQQFPYFIRTASYEPLRNKETDRGFFTDRGISGGQASRQRAFSRDRGYVRPGGLRTEGTSEGFYATAGPRRKKGEARRRTEEPDAPAAPATSAAPAVTAAAVTGAATAQPQATAAPAGKLGEALASRASEFSSKRDAAASELRQAWAAIGQSGVPGIGGSSIPWSDAKKRPDLAAAWLLDADASQLTEELGRDRSAVLDALSNRKAIADAVKARAGGSQSLGFGDPQLVAGLGLPDVKDSESLARYISDTAQRFVDYDQLASPSFFRSAGDNWSDSGPAQAPELSSINNQAGLDAYAAAHAEAAKLARSIGLEGDRPKRFADMKVDVQDRLKALKPFRDFRAAMQSAFSGDVAAAQTKAVAQKLSEAGITRDQLAEITGRSFGSDADVAGWAIGEGGVPGADRTAADLQRAWSLAAVSRLVDYAEGGDLVPKDEPALARVRKSAHRALSRPRVAVLPARDPRSLVAKRLVADQPLPARFHAQTG